MICFGIPNLQLTIILNIIYILHGYHFKAEDLKEFFNFTVFMQNSRLLNNDSVKCTWKKENFILWG